MTDPTWVHRAVGLIEADFQRSADTHLIKLDLPAWPGHPIYLKDESCHPSGSLKHRLARSLFLYGLCNGWIGPGTPIIESSSGNTAISEAYFARLLGLPFYAVMPRSTSPDKIEQIGFYGGHCHLVDGTDIYSAATALALELGGHYMDQFTYAERATDWRGNNNIAESIFEQMRREDQPIPRWIVVSAGTGGTSATIGRYIRYHAACAGITQLCVADPERSVFYDYYHSGDRSLRAEQGSRIEGIGRPRVEPSFLRSVVDRMLKVDDNASLAALQVLRQLTGRALGGSSGTHFVACCHLISEMAARGETGSVVTLICDSGDRYRGSYHNEQWLDEQGFELGPQREALEGFLAGKPYSLA